MNINNLRGNLICLLPILCLGALTLNSRAATILTGTSVTGSLKFVSNPNNYFDPANGYVPSGYSNTAGTTVTVSSPAVEFGFADATNTDSADFNNSQFTIEDALSSSAGGSDNAYTLTFTDPAFSKLGFAKVSDSFPNGGLSFVISGSQITISWAGGPVNANDDYTSTFVVVPEPSTWATATVGAGALGLVWRRRAPGVVVPSTE